MAYQAYSVTDLIISPRQVGTGAPAESALENQDSSSLADGCWCYVQTGAATGTWRFNRSSTATPDGTTIIAPIAGPGRWIKFTAVTTELPVGSASYFSAATAFSYTDVMQDLPGSAAVVGTNAFAGGSGLGFDGFEIQNTSSETITVLYQASVTPTFVTVQAATLTLGVKRASDGSNLSNSSRFASMSNVLQSTLAINMPVTLVAGDSVHLRTSISVPGPVSGEVIWSHSAIRIT